MCRRAVGWTVLRMNISRALKSAAAAVVIAAAASTLTVTPADAAKKAPITVAVDQVVYDPSADTCFITWVWSTTVKRPDFYRWVVSTIPLSDTEVLASDADNFPVPDPASTPFFFSADDVTPGTYYLYVQVYPETGKPSAIVPSVGTCTATV